MDRHPSADPPSGAGVQALAELVSPCPAFPHPEPPMLHDRPEGLDETPRWSSAPSRFLRSSRGTPRRSEVELRRLDFLRRCLSDGPTWIQPEKDEAKPLGYGYPSVEARAGLAPDTGRTLLEELTAGGYLRREIHPFVLLCPGCGVRTVEHVYLEPGARAGCRACGRAFSFEEGLTVRIHSYAPTRLACRAVALGRLVTPTDDELGGGRGRPSAPRSGSPRERRVHRLHPWKRWRAA